MEKSNFDQQQLEFSHPDTNQRIAWKGERGFSPVLLDIVEGVPFLVVYGRPDKKTAEIYGCPELPYVYLRYVANGWKPVSVENAPKELINANLSTYDVRNKNGRRLSQADVRRDVISFEQQSYGLVQEKIPRDYGEWKSIYKNSYRNERQSDDCRPPRILPPPAPLPPASEGFPEIIEAIDYTPERIVIGDDWTHLMFDQKRDGGCKNLFRPTDPDDYMQGQRFVNDSTGQKPVPYSQKAQFNMGVSVLCDDHLWFVTHREEKDKIVISKFTDTGDLLYRTSFHNPDRVAGFVGSIRVPSLRSDGGYLYFDWLDFRDILGEWHIKRWLKMRMREPDSKLAGGGKKSQLP